MTEIYIEIIATKGSAPRDAGTAMQVTATETRGTIGGGALEYQAVATARAILASHGATRIQTLPLGPGLGQCCGGAVTLQYTYDAKPVDRMQPVALDTPPPAASQPVALWLWGAGHVGRAVVRAAPAEAFAITWVDDAPDRFPPSIPANVTSVSATDMPRLAASTPTGAHHLIFTYSHDIDLALCAALITRDASSIGLIGSDTKWARFRKRLTAMGRDPSAVTCPIGDKSLGKTPDAIAQGTLHALIAMTQQRATA